MKKKYYIAYKKKKLNDKKNLVKLLDRKENMYFYNKGCLDHFDFQMSIS